jgi:type IV fimbrial biogenesis protein FimT
MHLPTLRPFAQRGFTLIELLVIMTVLAVMLGLGVPSFRNFIASQRVKSAAYELSTSMLLARSEAIKRNTSVTITPVTSGDWTSGWNVTYTAGGATSALQNQNSLSGVDVTGAPATITFGPTGRATATSVSYWQFAGATTTRCIRLDTAGVASTSSTTCP